MNALLAGRLGIKHSLGFLSLVVCCHIIDTLFYYGGLSQEMIGTCVHTRHVLLLRCNLSFLLIRELLSIGLTRSSCGRLVRSCLYNVFVFQAFQVVLHRLALLRTVYVLVLAITPFVLVLLYG